MKDVLKEAKSLKNNAKANKEIADAENDPDSYADALEELEQARELLINEISELENKSSSNKELQNDTLSNLARELADCFGIAGGIYRRRGELREAVKMYESGYELEKNPFYGIQDSYNMTNWIVVQLLDTPESFTSLTEQIAEATSIVQMQVEGVRRREWWAWADLGSLYLLNRNEALALSAYSEFKNNGALPKHYESSIMVLSELKEKLGNVAPEISLSIARAIEFLKQEKPNSLVRFDKSN